MYRLVRGLFHRGFLTHKSIHRYGDKCLSRETTDVVMLRGVSTIPFIYIDRERLGFQPELSARENELPGMEFYTASSKRYHNSTPMHLILQDSFYMKHNELTYYVVRNEPWLDSRDNGQLFVKYGGQSIEKLIKSILNNLPEREDGRGFHNYLIREVLEQSEVFKFRRVALERLIQIVERKISYFNKSWDPVERQLNRRGERIAFTWMTLLGSQMLLVNWCVYFYLSWDIMEPITVLLANIELLIAYCFFIHNKKEFSLKKITESAAERRRHQQMKRQAFDVRKYRELGDVLQYLRMRLVLIDGSGEAIVKLMSNDIRLLDDR